ncbi:MAG: prepilin-type N-terminal cleavage/methylation domain-containing protein [Terrimicrobiaceae bacterium]
MDTPLNNFQTSNKRRAFSLVEVLAAITIIGIITFLAVPNIVRVKQDGEDNLARARAETLNMAISSYVQAVGTNTAQTAWAAAANANARFLLISPYIGFAETNLTLFSPAGYTNTLPTSISPLTNKVTISGPGGAVNY